VQYVERLTTTKTEPFYRQLGERIARARLARNMPQSALAEALVPKLTRASIANIEMGKQRVMAHALIQIARELDLDLNELVNSTSGVVHPPSEQVAQELRKKLPEGANVVALERSLGLQLPAAPRRKTGR
jgi:transcriptional regulator with XRE-family HTH domain